MLDTVRGFCVQVAVGRSGRSCAILPEQIYDTQLLAKIVYTLRPKGQSSKMNMRNTVNTR